MARTGHEDRNDRGQAVVAFVISTSEDSIRRALGVEWETVRSSASFAWNVARLPIQHRDSSTRASFVSRCLRIRRECDCVCVYECSHPPLGMRLSSPLALLCQQLDYQTRRIHRINANKPVLVKFDSRTGSSTRLIFVVTVLASRYANYGRKKEMYTVVVNSWHNWSQANSMAFRASEKIEFVNLSDICARVWVIPDYVGTHSWQLVLHAFSKVIS